MEFISQFTIADLAILLTFAGGVLIGFQQGLLRYLLNGIVVLVSFVIASQLKGPIADALGSVWNMGTPEQQELWIYLLLWAIGIIGGFFVVRTFYGQTRLPIIRQVDEVLGAVAGVLWVALLYAFSLVTLDSFFLLADQNSIEAATILGPIYEFLNESFILSLIRDWVVPIAGFVVRPFVPDEIEQLLVP